MGTNHSHLGHPSREVLYQDAALEEGLEEEQEALRLVVVVEEEDMLSLSQEKPSPQAGTNGGHFASRKQQWIYWQVPGLQVVAREEDTW